MKYCINHIDWLKSKKYEAQILIEITRTQIVDVFYLRRIEINALSTSLIVISV